MKGRINRTPNMLNRTFVMAIFIAILKLKRPVTKFIKILKGFINKENKITVPILKNKLK